MAGEQVIQQPELWSDLDGTAVAKFPKTNIRNWFKYPLPIIPGYRDFLRGFQSDDEGRLGNIVSIRPDFWPRRLATRMTIERSGIEAFYPMKNVILAGSERAKAIQVVNAAGVGLVGMIDDKPHKIGKSLLDVMAMQQRDESFGLTLGAVQTETQGDSVERLLSGAQNLLDVRLNERGLTTDIITPNGTLTLIELACYSFAARKNFAHAVRNMQ